MTINFSFPLLTYLRLTVVGGRVVVMVWAAAAAAAAGMGVGVAST